MAYGMLVVSRSDACPALHTVEVPLFSDFDADYDILHGTETDWSEIELTFDGASSDDDVVFARVHRCVDPERVTEDISEWLEELAHAEPRRAAQWLSEWLRSARTMFAFTLYDHESDKALDALRAVMWSIQQAAGGLAYAEGEGWSNDDGHLVTWAFDADPALAGRWHCAVLDDEERWVGFEIELSNPKHQQAFREGRVPEGLPAMSLWPV